MRETKADTNAAEPAPMTTAEVLVELRQELAKQNELATQTLQLTLQIAREIGGERADNGHAQALRSVLAVLEAKA